MAFFVHSSRLTIRAVVFAFRRNALVKVLRRGYSHAIPIPSQTPQETAMNIRKNLALTFLTAVAAGLVIGLAIAAERPVEMASSPAPAFDASNVHVVVVKAPRLPR